VQRSHAFQLDVSEIFRWYLSVPFDELWDHCRTTRVDPVATEPVVVRILLLKDALDLEMRS